MHGPISISGNTFVCEEHNGENEGRTNLFSQNILWVNAFGK